MDNEEKRIRNWYLGLLFIFMCCGTYFMLTLEDKKIDKNTNIEVKNDKR
jgi:hypothetical protein